MMATRPLFRKSVSPLRRLAQWALVLGLIWLVLLLTRRQTEDMEKFWSPPIEPKGTVVVTENTPPESTPIQALPPVPPTGLATGGEGVAPAAPAMPASTTTVSSPENELAQVEEALKKWRDAWSSKNIYAYLNIYAKNFKPSNGMSREQWGKMRVERINSKKSISVRFENLEVRQVGERVITKFRQIYSDENFQAVGNKTLVWVKQQNNWMIAEENSD